jgi:hypothetical protein
MALAVRPVGLTPRPGVNLLNTDWVLVVNHLGMLGRRAFGELTVIHQICSTR